MRRRNHLSTTVWALCLTLAACASDDAASEADTDDPGSSSGPATTSSSTSSGASTSTTSSSSSTTGEPGTTTDASSTGEETEGASTGQIACDAEAFELPGDGFYPEGIAADGDDLYVGSLATGQVVRISVCDETVETFIEAEELTSAVGLRVDADRDLLWVCNSDSTFATFPSLDAFDLATGDRVATHGFGAPGFCNDITLDADGNIYATDSTGNRLVRVAADDALMDTPVQTWSEDAIFAVPMGQYGVNGIAWFPDDVLRVVNYYDGRLYEIPVAEDGSAGAVTTVAAESLLANPDGILRDGADLLVVEGGQQRLSRVQLDPWTVTPVADGFAFPTTVAVRGDDAWVAEGQLDHLFGFDPNPPELPFVVTRIGL